MFEKKEKKTKFKKCAKCGTESLVMFRCSFCGEFFKKNNKINK